MMLGDFAVADLAGIALAIAAAAVLALVVRLLRRRDGPLLRITLPVVLVGAAAVAIAATSADAHVAGIAASVALVLAGFALIQGAASLVFRVVLPAFTGGVPRIAHDLTAALLSLAWALLCLRLVGLDPTQLFATSALVTGLVAFSMQDTLGNVLGGVVVQLDRSLRVGDWVRSGDVNGQVVDVRWRYTTVQTRHGEQVVMPNAALMKNHFFVLRAGTDGAMQPWRRTLMLQVDWQADPTLVVGALEQGVNDADIPHVLEQPAPSAVLMEVGSGFCRYALRYWLADPRHDDTTDSAVRVHALAALARAGVRLGLPQQEQLEIKENEDWRTAQHSREAARRLDAIQHTDLFATLPPAEQQALANHLVHAPFAPGDTMTRQGAVAHWLYLIVRGDARVLVAGPEGPFEIARLTDGSVFGEMGMLTGEPRSATVIAASSVDCYRLDKVGFAQVLRARPEIATEISAVVEARNAQRNARLQAAGAPPRRTGDLLERIRNFFSLRP
ncbi:MAG TPA: mechanosensitive ion channel family protein [Ramlibacter sp.]